MKYSVIIPVYNAAATIGKCLDSLLQQPHEETEILVINDGSADESGGICRAYAAAHKCIRYFEQENGGVSSARNLGLEKAVGEYILFVDSDDYVVPEYFTGIDAALDRLKPELLLFGMRYVCSKCVVWDTGNYLVQGELDVAVKIQEAVHAYLLSNLMSKVFTGRIIREHQLRFDETLSIGEDQVFVFDYAMHVTKMASISDALYYFVCENTESLSRRRRDYLSQQLLQVNLAMLESLNAAQCTDQVRRIHMDSIIWTHYRSAYSACKELLKYNFTFAERKRQIREICDMYTLPQMKPTQFKSRVIAFPIIRKMCYAIDILAMRSYHRRKQLQ